jgi:hypothetical protein
MALAKFSKFKKERSVIKEARSKEKKIKTFQKLFNEKLGELGLSSTADLSEDQINKVLASLATVNEDRMREIEKDGIIAGKLKPAGTEGEVAKKHTFKSPQTVDAESESDAEDMKAEEAVEESTVDEIDEAEVTKADLDKVSKKADDAEKKADDAEDKAESADKAAEKAKDKASGGGDITSDAEFKKFAEETLKKAHPDDFDEKTAGKVIDGLLKKYKDDYGAAVGALTSGFGG